LARPALRRSAACTLACALALSAAAPAHAGGALWFFPNESDAVLRIVDGAIDGVPVQRTGWLVLGLDPAGAAAARAALAQDPAVAELVALRGAGDVLRLRPTDGDELALSRALRGRPGVRWAHPDLSLRLRPHALPDDPLAADQWHLENTGQRGWTEDADIDAERAWAQTTGAGLVAVIDGGVELVHPDLSVVPGADYIDGDADPSPEGDAHGTAASGLAAAVGGNGVGVSGVAQGAEVYAIRLIGGDTTLSQVRDAFVEATDAGADVLNNSWGFDNGCSTYALYGVLRAGLSYAEENGRGGRGSLVVISAGNGACDNSGDGLLNDPHVFGVGATTGNDGLEDYSSYGTGVDISAPSGGVLSTDLTGDPGYGSFEGDASYADFSGTSASAPIVSGAALLMFSANPELSAAQAREALCLSADKIDLAGGDYDETGWSRRYGCGRLNVGAAVALVANAAPGAPALLPFAGDPYEDRVVLRITPPIDPDGDALRCEARVWPAAEAPPPAAPGDWQAMDAAALDLTGALEVGAAYGWTARCADGWIAGPEAAPAAFVVQPVPARADTGAPAADDGAGEGGDAGEDGVSDDVSDTGEAGLGAEDEEGDGKGGGCAGALPLLLLAPWARRRRG
jgi:hypothetical protein